MLGRIHASEGFLKAKVFSGSLGIKWFNMRSKWLNVGVIVFTAILWAMQMIPQEHENELFIFPYLRKSKYWIAFFSFLIIIVYHLYDIIVERTKVQKKWIKKFLQHIVNLELGGNNYHTRVTIFRAEKGYNIFLKRFWYFMILRFIENFKQKSWKKSFKQIPIHLLSDYLYVYQRYSFPREKKSYTYFRVIKDNGVAVKCFMEGVDCEVKTNCITDINLPSNQTDLTGVNKKRVKRYMRDSFIAEDNYETLISMVKRANNIYATPIINDQQRIWGVLIIDNDEQEEMSFKEKVDSFIDRYIKIFVFTITHLKMK